MMRVMWDSCDQSVEHLLLNICKASSQCAVLREKHLYIILMVRDAGYVNNPLQRATRGGVRRWKWWSGWRGTLNDLGGWGPCGFVLWLFFRNFLLLCAATIEGVRLYSSFLFVCLESAFVCDLHTPWERWRPTHPEPPETLILLKQWLNLRRVLRVRGCYSNLPKGYILMCFLNLICPIGIKKKWQSSAVMAIAKSRMFFSPHTLHTFTIFPAVTCLI